MKPSSNPHAIRSFAALIAVAAFWAGMLTAAHLYRPAYDWPYQTISVLLYSDKNPAGFLWAWAGLQVAGIAGLVWSFELSRPVRGNDGPRSAPSARLLQAGFLCMGCTVIPQRLLPWSKGHEAFAILAFLAICSGIAGQMNTVARSQNARRPTAAARFRVFASTVLPLVAPVLAAATQAYLDRVRPELPWVTPEWRVLGASPLLSFGLWEWVTSAVFSVCLMVIWRSRRDLHSPPITRTACFRR